ncbi:MAG: PhoH family protein [Gammaproteobacteria bacterium]|nr:PhoH family protein [Gammaproteobacteria bacterium]
MNSAARTGKRLFVLDTNVLLHDPTSLFRFKEHDIYLPMMVLEELDAAKKGVSEVARNARQVSRFLDGLIDDADRHAIEAGLALPAPASGMAGMPPSGRLYLQTSPLPTTGALALPGKTPDNSILNTALALKGQHPTMDVTLVSKDINLRIKSRVIGISAEDYFNDRVLDDINLLYTGTRELPQGFWEAQGEELKCWQDESRTFYSLPTSRFEHFYPNEFLYGPGEEDLELVARRIDQGKVILERVRDYRHPRNAVWGMTARNREQSYALNLLMDPDIDFVTLLGAAGTGKTLLALAAGLAQSLDTRRYREVIVTRETVPLGEDIGFLPGTEEEKMNPWMGALLDNLEVLSETQEGGEWSRAATADLLQNRVKVRSMNFMRGRTFFNRYLIIDEAQNLTAKQMRTLITRAGSGTKIVCCGNIAQIDTPYLSETTSGLTYTVDRFKDWAHGGHITLLRGERSRLADYAVQRL